MTDGTEEKQTIMKYVIRYLIYKENSIFSWTFQTGLIIHIICDHCQIIHSNAQNSRLTECIDSSSYQADKDTSSETAAAC